MQVHHIQNIAFLLPISIDAVKCPLAPTDRHSGPRFSFDTLHMVVQTSRRLQATLYGLYLDTSRVQKPIIAAQFGFITAHFI